jgi:hypothetical protein
MEGPGYAVYCELREGQPMRVMGGAPAEGSGGGEGVGVGVGGDLFALRMDGAYTGTLGEGRFSIVKLSADCLPIEP